MADFADDDEGLEMAADRPEVEKPLDAQPEALTEQDDDDGETVITIDGEDDASPASSEQDGTQLVRHLRQTAREQAKEIARLRAQTAPAPVAIDPGPKPTLESCGYEPDDFERELDAWKERKAKADVAVAEAKKGQEAAEADWRADLTRYDERKAALRLPDYQDAEDAVTAALSPVAQAVLVKAAADPAIVVAALGKHPAKLEALSKIADPIKLAVAVVNLERTIKVNTTRRAPAPERIPSGGAPMGNRTDKHLERLEAEADRTGDRTKVAAYKRSLRKA
jgi:hypothetical protein